MTLPTIGYGRTAIALHWLIALLIFCAFPLGVYMHELPFSPGRLKLYSYHKWIGVTVFLLAIARVAWRIGHPAPPPAGMPAWQRIASVATHHLLYVLILAVPVSGWLMSSAKGFQTVYLGMIPLPDLLAKDKELGDMLTTVHQILNFTMAALVITHVAAALKHYVVDRDEVLGRMIPLLDRKK
ncbi:MAG: cytochrome b [Rhodocyclaceae bacterium]|uniref:Cytochrome b n=1 Tax=Candidatus Desulfobacillus denitrificans TaxID=2608985 RepID=A0A809S833_9PROT|nr:cytochrome b [Candidatus Desulfobacillus denitrificans]GIK45475.1 MAG: cytochrome b [Betaproteobacteria bacterium]GJQ54363.1 MAG: cytochrome b [Rhodocyclaceae bacterium]